MKNHLWLALSVLAVAAAWGCNDEIKVENRTFLQLCEMSGGEINKDNSKQCMCGQDKNDKCDEGVTCINNGEFCANSTEICTPDKENDEICINIKSVGHIKVCQKVENSKYYYVDKSPQELCVDGNNEYSCTADKSTCGICKNNSRKCENSTIFTCENGVWIESYSCPNGASCLTNAVSDSDDSLSYANCGECKNNDNRCVTSDSVSKSETCVNGVWTTDMVVNADGESVENNCNGYSCKDNTACAECVNGKKKCSDGVLSTCVNGIWTDPVVCPFNATCIEADKNDETYEDYVENDHVYKKCGICADGNVKCENGKSYECTNGKWGNEKDCPTGKCDESGKLCGSCEPREQKCIVNTNADGTTQESVYTCVNGAWSVEDCADFSCQTKESEEIVCGDCKNDDVLSCENIQYDDGYTGAYHKCENGSKEGSLSKDSEFCDDYVLCAESDDVACGQFHDGDRKCDEIEDETGILKHILTIYTVDEETKTTKSDTVMCENEDKDYTCVSINNKDACGCVKDNRRVVYGGTDGKTVSALQKCNADGQWETISFSQDNRDDNVVCKATGYYELIRNDDTNEIVISDLNEFECKEGEEDTYIYECENGVVKEIVCKNDGFGCVQDKNKCAECESNEVLGCREENGKVYLSQCKNGEIDNYVEAKDESGRLVSCTYDNTDKGECFNGDYKCIDSDGLGSVNTCINGKWSVAASCGGVSCHKTNDSDIGAVCGVCLNGSNKCINNSSNEAVVYTCDNGKWEDAVTNSSVSCNADGTNIGGCKNGVHCENSENIGFITVCTSGSSYTASCVDVSCSGNACGICRNADRKCVNDQENKAVMYVCDGGQWKEKSKGTLSCNSAGSDIGECLNNEFKCENKANNLGVLSVCANGRYEVSACPATSCNGENCGECLNGTWCRNKDKWGDGNYHLKKCDSGIWPDNYSNNNSVSENVKDRYMVCP